MTRPQRPRPAILVHDGAWDIPEDEKDAHLAGARDAVAAGWDVLEGGGSALEAVTAAVLVMEDDPTLNAARGGVLCRDGWVEMDAAVMDGRDLNIGAVASLRDVRNPVLLAREVLRSDHVLLVGPPASAFARERGVPLCDPAELVVERERRRLEEWRRENLAPKVPVPNVHWPSGTVGAVAIDAAGHYAAAASTAGMVGKRSGRVGDTPVPGCGYFAQDARGAAACTGHGEKILRVALARRAIELAERMPAGAAAESALAEMERRVQGKGGVILIAADGSLGYAFNTESMAVAAMDAGRVEPFVGGVRGR